ncbi:MAG: amidohydrolase [Clostridiales bacterium]|nr:amidohydrolase [Clostridiales bacterium]
MMIIDTHAHIYPDAIALRAAKSIGEFYDIPMCMDGTLSCLLERGGEAGISRFLVHSVAVTHERVQSINTYLMNTAAEHGEKLIGFGTMHPDFPDHRAELQRIKDGGLHGVKMHPDFQHFYLDDENAIALFQAMAEMGLPALIHTGDFRQTYSEPRRMAKVLDIVPDLKVICAHLGGWSVWSEGWKHLAGRKNLWVDTSSSLYAISPQEAADIIHRYGVDRVFFGTDYPMWTPKEELERFMALPLTDEEREKILHLNFEKFMADLEK